MERWLNYPVKRQEIADEITKANGGFRPIDLDLKVRERLKSDVDTLVKEGLNISDKVLMRSPDGKVYPIPKSQAEAAKASGGVLVE